MDVLVLNTTYEPLQILNLKKALKLIIKGRVEVVCSSGGVIHGTHSEFPKPSVIKLHNYVKYHRKPVAFSKRNVLERDRYICQYCGTTNNKMTIDHVVPQSKGGENTFENTVACCSRCNIKKADLDLWDTDMVLKRNPRRPSQLVFMKATANRPEWAEYMFV